MRNHLFAVFAASLGAVALPAHAVTVTSGLGAPDPGAPGQTLLVDFESPTLPAGYALTGAFAFAKGTSKISTAPAGDASTYLYVSSALSNGIATLSTANLSAVSFYWGSIDSFNSVDVLLKDGSFVTVRGGRFPPHNGAATLGTTNRRVFFTADAGETITGLRFKSTNVAFEVDNVYGIVAGVPEPQSWAMLIAGFGMIGAASRRRRANVAAA